MVRQEQVVDGKTIPARTRPTSNATINRELQMLERTFALAVQSGRLAQKPYVAMPREGAARSGFF